jgi:hypothetical protein
MDLGQLVVSAMLQPPPLPGSVTAAARTLAAVGLEPASQAKRTRRHRAARTKQGGRVKHGPPS